MEIIVAHLPNVQGLAKVCERYPQVRFQEVQDLHMYTGLPGSREHHDEIRARGLALARGNVVALIEDHGVASEDWSARLLETHAQGFAGVGGAIENGIDKPLNWAVYFCDFLRYQRPLPQGESAIASDANVSYKRAALEKIQSVWKEVFHEHTVNSALRAEGERLALAPEAVVYQNRLGLKLGPAMKERFVWGRSYAATRAALSAPSRRVFYAVFSPVLPLLMLARMKLMAWQKRRTFVPFVKALPLTALLVVSWSWGEFVGYITGRANSAGAKTAEALARGSHVG
jgi:hypothetical protein